MTIENPFKKSDTDKPNPSISEGRFSFDILKEPVIPARISSRKKFEAEMLTGITEDPSPTATEPQPNPTDTEETHEIARTNPELQKYLLEAARIARKQHPEIFTKGKCEQSVRLVMSRAIELAKGLPLGSTDKMRIRWTQIDKALTAMFRGKQIRDLTETDLQNMKPGTTIYMASKPMYASKGVKIRPGTSTKLPVISDTARHWVMWDGAGFTDNWGTRRTLEQLKRLVGGQKRVIINIHDPFGQYGVA